MIDIFKKIKTKKKMLFAKQYLLKENQMMIFLCCSTFKNLIFKINALEYHVS